MEQIGNAVNLALVQSRSGTPSSVALQQPNAASTSEIGLIVTKLEFQKQIKPLDEIQRRDLIELLHDLNETSERIQLRANSVLLKQTYGTIAFEYWVQDLVCVYDERQRIERGRIHEELSRCLDRLRRLSRDEQRRIDEEAAELLGLEDAQRDWELKLAAIRERSRQQHKRRFAFARKALAALDEASRRKVLDEAVKKDVIASYDQAMVDNIHLFADKFYSVLEEMGKCQQRKQTDDP